MHGIKYALSFIWGLLYAICMQVWLFAELKTWSVIPIMFLVASSFAIIILVMNFLITNWSEL